MGLKADLLKFYFSLETRYYKACDLVEKRGISIYEFFVTPLESNGVPSFPVALLFCLLLLFLIAFVFMQAPASGSISVYVKVIGADSQPVENALVELLNAQNAVIASAPTNLTGEVFFENKQSAVQLKVTHADYEASLNPVRENLIVTMRLKTVQAQRPVSTQIQEPSESFVGDVNQFIEIEQLGSFNIQLKRKDNGQFLNGVVSVYDAATDNKIAEVETVGGNALLENLVVNQHVYFHSIIPNFLANKSEEFTVKRERQRVVIEFQPVQMTNATISVISALTRQPLSGSQVKLFDENNVELANGTIPTTGNLTFSLPVGLRYYVNARKSQFLTNVTQIIPSTQSVVISLSPANPESTSILEVNLADEYGESITGIASLYTQDRRILEQKNQQMRQHQFTSLQRGLNVVVKASSHDLTTQQALLLSEAFHQITLQLEFRFAFLAFRAFDALTLGQIENVDVSVKRNGAVYENCTVPCFLRVKTRGVYLVDFTRGDYFSYLFALGRLPNHQVFEEGTTTELNASMMSLAGVEDSQVVLNGVYDASTFQKIQSGENLRQNRVYLASLSGYFRNSLKNGLYFNVTSSSRKASILNFTPYPESESSPGELTAMTSTSFLAEECGVDLNGQKWKRAVLEFPSVSSTHSQNYQFFFVTEPSENYYDDLQVNYKTFIQREGGEVVRNPFDQDRGTTALEFQGDKSECTAKTYSSDFKVISPNEDVNELGALQISFNQNRQVSSVEITPSPASCGSLTSGEGGDLISSYDEFDCNEFPVDSGVANPFNVKAKLQLNHNAKRGILRFYSNQDYFRVLSAVASVPPSRVEEIEVTGPIFEKELNTVMGPQGTRDIELDVALNVRGSATETSITIEFVEIFENGTVNQNTLNKTISVSVNELRMASSESLLSGYSCTSLSMIKFDYDYGLLPTGSGWEGCGEIPLIIDPVFPADAIPIYVENSTERENCFSGEGGEAREEFGFGNVIPKLSSRNGENCFELVPDDDLEPGLIQPLDGYKGYLLKFNAMKCGGVIGNEIFTTNATLDLTCNIANPRGFGFDNKTINITVIKQGGDWMKNLHFVRLKNETTMPKHSLENGGTYFYNPPAGSQCPEGTRPVFVTNDNLRNNAGVSAVFEIGLEAGYDLTRNLNRSGSVNNICNGLDLTRYFNFEKRLSVNRGAAACGKPVEIKNIERADCRPKLNIESQLEGNIRNLESSAPFGHAEQRSYGDEIVAGFTNGCYYCAARSTNSRSPALTSIDPSNYVFAFTEKKPIEIPLDPQLFLIVDNLQLRPTEREGKRDFSFMVFPDDADEYYTLLLNGFEDQPGRAFAVAIRSQLSPIYDEGVNAVTMLQENSVPIAGVSIDSLSRPLPYASMKVSDPFLEYVQAADSLRLASAFRRSLSSSSVNYYCLEGERPSVDQNICRPTLNDWVRTTSSISTRSQPCTVCQPSVNCDSACNSETRTKPNGAPCFNACGFPICDSADICVGGVKQVEILGRTTEQWLNSSNLVSIPLYSVSGLSGIAQNINFVDAPFKYFPEYTRGTFNYTMAVKVPGRCKDSPAGNFWQSDTCFAGEGTRSVLERYGRLGEGINSVWFGTSAPNDYGTLKLSEQQGGCGDSKKWDRGYYWVTFTYARDYRNNWNWFYSAAPIEVSPKYVEPQGGIESDVKHCVVPSLSENRNAQLCYAIFSTSLKVSDNGPGYCVRSLRDYIPAFPNNRPGSQQAYVAASDIAALQSSKLTIPMQQNVPRDRVLIRDMDIEFFGESKCPLFADGNDLNIVRESEITTCTGGNVCDGQWTITKPSMSVNHSTIGITKGGTVDWIVKVEQDNAIDRQFCDDSFWGDRSSDGVFEGDWSNWDGEEGDAAFGFTYRAVDVNGNPAVDSRCYRGCYLRCSDDFYGGCEPYG